MFGILVLCDLKIDLTINVVPCDLFVMLKRYALCLEDYLVGGRHA